MNSKLGSVILPILLFAGGFFFIGRALMSKSRTATQTSSPVTPACPPNTEITLTDEVRKHIDENLEKWGANTGMINVTELVEKIERAEKRMSTIYDAVNKAKLFNDDIAEMAIDMGKYFKRRKARIKEDRTQNYREILVAGIADCGDPKRLPPPPPTPPVPLAPAPSTAPPASTNAAPTAEKK
jgi:hypothetical protein